MTRRKLLTLIPASAGLKVGHAAPSFDRFNVHMHIHRPAPVFLAGMEAAGWRGLSICDSRAVGAEPSDLDEMLRGTARMHRESKGRMAWAATFDPRGWEDRDFTSRTIANLRKYFEEGAIGVKIWKNVGMKIQSKSGEYLLPDHKVLMPLYEAIRKADRTLIAHLAEPDGAWMPLDDRNPEIGYYKNNPQWHMYGQPGAPSKQSILASRDRILSAFPKLRLIGCHLGSNEDNLPELAGRLDRHPNFAVDLAARVRYLASGERESVRQFLTKYQDRIVYGTDSQLETRSEEAAWKAVNEQQEREWSFLATGETMQIRNREAQGLSIPESVLRKIFHDNPRRWLPGIAG